MEHTYRRHTVQGIPENPTEGSRSVFFAETDWVGLILAAERLPSLPDVSPQARGRTRCYRIAHTVSAIGVDATVGGMPTNIYSVITEMNGDLVSAYPGYPTASQTNA